MTTGNFSPQLATVREADSHQQRGSPERAELLSTPEAPGASSGRDSSNGLRRFAGGWSDDEFKSFQNAVAPLGEIDDELWR